uniref:cytokinin dehydrogenase n=1 Tax=Ananas comosus var. bracteatus TaxID=296719 RepID=A0A6V7P5Q4_ANACO|nr:unnamed protein product [Ananas comosus var. bracteatus]
MMIACLEQERRQRLAPGEPDAEPICGGGGGGGGGEGDAAALVRALELQGGGAAAAEACAAAAEDFGGIVRARPAAVLRPSAADDVARAVRAAARSGARALTVAARGNGHSVAGQAMAAGGLVLDMRALGPRMHLVSCGGGGLYADVGGGALWGEVLAWGVANCGMAPASWTDYLRLTVGGTLSNGGISGQTFRHGPQISNVAELEIVTADGDSHVCSPSLPPTSSSPPSAASASEVAEGGVRGVRGVRGGRGAAGDAARVGPGPGRLRGGVRVRERARPGQRLALRADPGRVRVRFDPDRIPPDSGPVLYCLELALHYDRRDRDNVDERIGNMLRPLRHVRGLEFAADVSYVDFLSRVNCAEEEARANGTWAAPHPWLNLLVAARDIPGFDREVFKRVLRKGIGGPMLVYPLVKSKWDPRTSVALPNSEVFYLVALLRFTRPYRRAPQRRSWRRRTARSSASADPTATISSSTSPTTTPSPSGPPLRRRMAQIRRAQGPIRSDGPPRPGQQIFPRAHAPPLGS